MIVSHGVTLRAIMMMWLHLSPGARRSKTLAAAVVNERFRRVVRTRADPKNCSIGLITHCMDGGFIHGGHEHPRKDLLINDEAVSV